MSDLESTLQWQLRALNLTEGMEREYRFAPPRRFRADFAWPARKLLVEVDGAVWSGGRHTRPQGFMRDQEKLNLATTLGYRVLRFSGPSVEDGSAVRVIEEVLMKEEA